MSKHAFRKFFVFAVFLAVAAVAAAGSFAQSSDPAPAPASEPGQTNSSYMTGQDGLAVQDEYITTKFLDLSRAYWAVGKFDLADNDAIDKYMMINECELYRNYYENEFEWTKIRDSMRDYISKNVSNFPTKFEVMVPVYLGPYDIEKEEFSVMPESLMTATRKIDVIVNAVEKYCNMWQIKEIEGYPSNIVVYLNRPIVFVRLPMKRELATLYIDYAERTYEDLPREVKRDEKVRVAFLRLKVKLIQYKNTESVDNGQGSRAVILTQLDGVEVYADMQKTQLLFRQDIKSKKLRQLRKPSEGGSGTRGSGGEGGAPSAEPDAPVESAPAPAAEPAAAAIPERAPSTGE